MARRDTQRLTRRLKDAGAIAIAALKQLEEVLDEIGDHDLSPTETATVQRQLEPQTEAIEQRLGRVRAAGRELETGVAISPKPEPKPGRRTAKTRRPSEGLKAAIPRAFSTSGGLPAGGDEPRVGGRGGIPPRPRSPRSEGPSGHGGGVPGRG